jgi:oligosaccharide reducing-end xylanase
MLGAAALLGVTTLVGLAQTSSRDGDGAYATGKYRNLFVEAGHSPSEVKAKIDAAYEQLFHGDPQTQAVAFPAGSNANGPLMYLTDWANHDVRTEGMSYGMMIAVQLNKKREFDALWNWAKTFMYASDRSIRLMDTFPGRARRMGRRTRRLPRPMAKSILPWPCFLPGTAGRAVTASTTITPRR